MRITAIEVIPVAVPLKGGFRNAHAVKMVQHSIVTRVETDAGLAGYGNVTPDPGYSEVTPGEEEAADIVKLKVMKQGGFCRTRQMMDIAEAAGLRVVIGHGFGLAVNTMAEVQVAATSPNVLDAVECVGPLKLAEDIACEPIHQMTGITKLPEAPGIGVTVDERRLERLRISWPLAAAETP